ncbi:MAG: putative SAM-dependent methyltransferase [Bacteroidetes bacterium]|nr:putative SAM-dependent methyltransferase [Bacteroidota bacterium]
MNTLHLDKYLILRKKEDRRVVAGHPWVFSNEIHEIKGNPVIGDVVELRDAGGLSLGIGLFNPHSLIAFRMLSRTVEEIDYGFFERRIKAAIDLRKMLYPNDNACRLVHGEGDFMPGLIVDKYDDVIAVQTFAFGMDSRLQWICDALESLLHPRGIVERNESSLRTLEKLEQKKGILRGTSSPTLVEEHGLTYSVDPLEGQKTGFFLDQRENRLGIRRYAGSATVLDCFCNDGGFALNASVSGAAAVTGIDASEDAINRARYNATLNNLTAVQFERADVFDKLEEFGAAGNTFDVVVLDPPSFTKNRKTVPAARKGYKDLHMRAFKVLHPGGILLTASCSHHIEPDVFLSIVEESARKAERSLQLLEWRGAAPDHPSLPSVPETRYLKLGVFRCF